MSSGPSDAARIAHNLGLATWFGGTLSGQVALNPTVGSIREPRERGRVVNESWGRFNAANTAAILAALASWRPGGLKADADLREPGASRAKNLLLLLGEAALTSIASAVLGARTADGAPSDAPSGGTPIEPGIQPTPETPASAARAQRLIGSAGASSISMLAGAIAPSAAIGTPAVKPRSLFWGLIG